MKLAAGIPVELSTPDNALEWGRGLELDTPKGKIRARAVIVTASTDVLSSGRIAFSPDLPKRQLDALNALSLGSYEHIAMQIPGNPFALDPDDLVFEKATGARTAALLANIGGSDLCTVDVAGPVARELAGQGESAMLAFAAEWLASIFGSDIRKRVTASRATRWSENPLALGAFSVAKPGRADARGILFEPLRERVFFAGEAVHETLWGTVGGAWDSGTRAAEAALKAVGALKEPAPEKPQRRQQRRQKQKQQPRRRRER
jgi:monoamine oxidase